MTDKNKRNKIILILTALSFFASGIDSFENNHFFFGAVNIFVAVLNVIAMFFIEKRLFTVKILLMLLNTVFALFSAVYFYLTGKNLIQYGWLLVFICYLIASFVVYKKHLNNKRKK